MISSETYREHLLDVALSQVGVTETSENTGPLVDRYLRSVGLEPGNPWCVAFLFWCQIKVHSGMAGVCPATGVYPVLPATGSSSYLYRWARRAGRLVKRPKPGDVFLVRGGYTGWRHAGYVLRFSGLGVETVEGNTNRAGGAEGIKVMRRTRPNRHLAFIDMTPRDDEDENE